MPRVNVKREINLSDLKLLVSLINEFKVESDTEVIRRGFDVAKTMSEQSFKTDVKWIAIFDTFSSINSLLYNPPIKKYISVLKAFGITVIDDTKEEENENDNN